MCGAKYAYLRYGHVYVSVSGVGVCLCVLWTCFCPVSANWGRLSTQSHVTVEGKSTKMMWVCYRLVLSLSVPTVVPWAWLHHAYDGAIDTTAWIGPVVSSALAWCRLVHLHLLSRLDLNQKFDVIITALTSYVLCFRTEALYSFIQYGDLDWHQDQNGAVWKCVASSVCTHINRSTDSFIPNQPKFSYSSENIELVAGSDRESGETNW